MPSRMIRWRGPISAAVLVMAASGCGGPSPVPGEAPPAPASASPDPSPLQTPPPAAAAPGAVLPGLEGLPPLPPGSPARPIEVVRMIYAYAAERPDVLQYVPCFCGCERAGHVGNDDCFVSSRDSAGRVTGWDAHGVG